MPTQRLISMALLRVRPASLADQIKRAVGINRRVIEPDHGRFFVDPCSNLGWQPCEHGSYEDSMRLTIEEYLPPEGVFLDVGANDGYFTVIAARRCGRSGHVVAVEPQQRLVPILEENIRLNELNKNNVWVLSLAVTDVPGAVTLHLMPSINSGASGLHRATKYRVPTQIVAARTLAQIFDDEKLSRVDLMKVDIEGFEYEALLGSRSVFEEMRVRVLALELHPTILAKRGKEVSDIVAMLGATGYVLAKHHGNTVWVAKS
jgi:FkbM family methyltransferase